VYLEGVLRRFIIRSWSLLNAVDELSGAPGFDFCFSPRGKCMSRKSIIVAIIAIVLAGVLISIMAGIYFGRPDRVGEEARENIQHESVDNRELSRGKSRRRGRRERGDVSTIDHTVYQRPEFGIFYSDWAGKCSIYGRVTGADSEPVYQAELELYPLKTRGGYGYGSLKIGSETSDWEGSFAFPDIRKGEYAVVARKKDLVTTYSQIIRLESDGDTATIELEMPEGVNISGTVVDEDGEGVAGAKVSCSFRERGNVHIWNKDLGGARAVSGDDGSFEISELMNDMEYFISAQLQEKTHGPGAGSVYGTEDAQAGDEDVVITLRSRANGCVGGTVYNIDGQTPVKGARVVLFAWSLDEYSTEGQATTDDSGVYIISAEIYSDEYKIIAYTESFFGLGRRLVSAPMKLDMEDDEVRFGVDLFLGKGSNISGKVLVKETGKPVAGLKITAKGIRGVLENKPQFSISGPKGEFKISSLIEGVYILNASSKSYTSDIENLRSQAKALEIEGKDEFRNTISSRYSMGGFGLSAGIVRVGPGTSAEGLVFTVLAGRRVNGVVIDTNGKNIPWAKIKFDGSNEDSLYFHQEARSRQDGSFQIKALSPFVDKWRINLEHDEYLETQDELEFSPGETVKEVSLVMSAGLSISGKVTDSGGAPVSGAAIVIGQSRYSLPVFGVADAKTDREGMYTIDSQIPGTYALAARKKGFASDIREEVVLEDEDLYRMDFCLGAGMSIKGRILFDDGKPLKNFNFIARLEKDREKIADFHLRSGDDGAFTLNDLEDDTFDIAFAGSGRRNRQQSLFRFRVTAENVAAGTDNLEIVLDALGTISGQVVDKDTGQTVEQYVISIRSLSYGVNRNGIGHHGPMGMGMLPGRNWPQHEDGRFVLEDIYPGEYVLYIRAEGHVFNSKRIMVLPGDVLSGVRIELLKGFKLSGRVVEGPGSKPVEYAKINISGPLRGNSGSGPTGKFIIYDVPPGSYILNVKKQDAGSVETNVVVDGDLDLGDIVIAAEGKCTLTGDVVIEAEGDIKIVYLHAGAEKRGFAKIKDGSYSIENLSPGPHDITLWYKIDDGRGASITRKTTVKEGVENRLDFVVPYGVRVSCSAKLNGVPVRNADISLIGSDGTKAVPSHGAIGSFGFNNIVPGQYKVVASQFQLDDISVSSTMRDVVYRRDITVGSEDMELTLDIRTFSAKGVLYGADGNAAIYRKMVAAPADGGEGERKFYTDGYGEFSFYGCQDGNYRIYVVREGVRKFSGDYFFQTGGSYSDLMFYEK
jgi:protocatechuate 3,4-dioxygenase beta subunit